MQWFVRVSECSGLLESPSAVVCLSLRVQWFVRVSECSGLLESPSAVVC